MRIAGAAGLGGRIAFGAAADRFGAKQTLVLGLLLQDKDVTDIPMIAADPYGNFIPGPARGLPQYVTTTGLVEGNTAAPVPVPANAYPYAARIVNSLAARSSSSRDPPSVSVSCTACETIFVRTSSRSPKGISRTSAHMR